MNRRLTPAQVRYRAYLQTPHWQQLRARILARAGTHCEWCGRFCGRDPHPGTRYCGLLEECEWCRVFFDEGIRNEREVQTLEVHHTSYERLGHERDADVVAICWSCHDDVTDRWQTLRDFSRAGDIAKADATHEAATTRFWRVLAKVIGRGRS